MGLDQFAFRIKKRDIISDIAVREHEGKRHEELYYWRKVPNLQGWMEDLYREKGGADVFNCRYVRLTEKDLDRLAQDVRCGKLPETTGFFFGEHDEADMLDVMEFIGIARQVLRDSDDAVYYSSWW